MDPDPSHRGLRLVLFDRTCRGSGLRPGLSQAWWLGTRLYRACGRIDAFHGVASWGEGLAWLTTFAPELPIAQVQYWGHGKWGRAMVDDDTLDLDALRRDAPHQVALQAIARRFAPDATGREVRWWFRTCETFGGLAGHRFAQAWAETLGFRVAAHTFIIGAVQSGLHSLAPGEVPSWSPVEGIAEGTPAEPRHAYRSTIGAPHTVTCLHTQVPQGY